MFEKKIAFIGETGAGKKELSLHVLQRERASGGQGNLVHTLPADSPALATMAAVTDEAGISLLSMLQLRESSEIPDEDPSRAVVFDIESAPSALASVSAYLKTHPAARADMRVYYVLNARLSETGTAEQIQASVLGMQEQLDTGIDGIINNTNCGRATVWADVLAGAHMADHVSRALDIPLFGTSGTFGNLFNAAHQFSPRPTGALIPISAFCLS